ncbi:MAG: isoprenylcysteine carboxylmethyltransferase family protein [Mariniblastus sp.]|nr:isoprenylcysteine carboxylmethyltransferase family protein [Mariniblastus sp.]
MDRYAWFGYGLLAALAGLAATLYSVAFLGNLGLEFSLDSPPRSSWRLAVLVDLAWLLLFALQHSGMARSRWKTWLAQYFPAAAERSTYVLVSSLLMGGLFLTWQPIGGMLWDVRELGFARVIYGLYFAGWLIMAWSISLIGSAEMLGMKQTWSHWTRRSFAGQPLIEPGPYRFVRHPVYLGWLIVFWASPVMSIGHLGLALGLSLYILLAIAWEEQDLLATHGAAYRDYRARVPMLLPLGKGWPGRTRSVGEDGR